jgi:glycosyltransferase involved in cell wall biosynthesis
MGVGNCVIAYDTPENREVVGDCGLLYRDVAELSRHIQWALDDPSRVTGLREKAQARAKELYSWDAITRQYEKLFEDMRHSS